MLQYSNLLVAIDTEHDEQPALSRALDIAQKSSKRS